MVSGSRFTTYKYAIHLQLSYTFIKDEELHEIALCVFRHQSHATHH